MPLMRAIRDQIVYFRRLSAKLGRRQAVRVRLVGLAGRLGLHRRACITLFSAPLRHGVVARIASTDFDVFGQVFRDGEYAVLADLDPAVIVDCGANVGYTSAYLLSIFPRARVIAIEPFAANAALCRRNLAPYGERARVIEAAIRGEPGRLAIDATDGNEWGIEVRAVRPGEPGTVDAIDIPSLGLPQIDLLKVDIEGSEVSLFGPGAAAWLPSVANIAVELHGPECERVFFAALEGYDYALARSGELTICRNLRRRAG